MTKDKKSTSIRPKEFLYLDEIEINSILAQLEGGLPQLIHELHQVISGVQSEKNKTKGHKEPAGFSVGAKGQLDYNAQTGSKQIDSDSTMNQRAIDTIYSDYAVNIITKRLHSNQLLAKDTSQDVGAIVNVKSDFRLTDFDQSEQILSFKNPIYKDIVSDDHSEKGNLEPDTLMKAAQSFKQMFPNTSLVQISGAAVFAENNNFRMNAAQRLTIKERKTKITVLGIVEKIIDADDLTMESDDLSFSNYAISLPLMALGQYDLIKENDRLIKPIAIYFE